MKSKNLNKFLKAIEIYFSDYSKANLKRFWPATAGQLDSSFIIDIAYDIFRKFKENPQKCKEALLKLRAFNLYAGLYHSEILGLKIIKKLKIYSITQKEIMDFASFFFDVIQEKIKGEIFCLDGSHKVLSQSEVRKLNKGISWTKVKNLGIKRAIGDLIVSSESLIWALYFDAFPDAGAEKHGPYSIKDGILIVREYYDLNPKEIWKINNKYPKLTMYLKYSKNTNISFSYANQLSNKEPIYDKLISFSIKINGKKLSKKSELNSLSNYYSKLTQKQALKVNKLSPIKIMEKGAEIYYYRLKGFFKYYGEDWRPPTEVYSFIKNRGLEFWKRYKSYGYQKFPGKYHRKLFDPRNYFTGK